MLRIPLGVPTYVCATVTKFVNPHRSRLQVTSIPCPWAHESISILPSSLPAGYPYNYGVCRNTGARHAHLARSAALRLWRIFGEYRGGTSARRRVEFL